MESQQGLSYGANDMRDGVSLSATRKTRPLVLPTQIANLENLEGFLRLPGDIPVAHFRLKRGQYPVAAPAFVPAVVSVVSAPPPTADVLEQEYSAPIIARRD